MGIEYVGEAKMFNLAAETGMWKISLMGDSVTFEGSDGSICSLPLEVILETAAGVEKIDPLSVVQEEVGVEISPEDITEVEEPTTPVGKSPSIEISDIELPEDAEPPTEEELKMLVENEESKDSDIPLTRPTVKMDSGKKIGKSIG